MDRRRSRIGCCAALAAAAMNALSPLAGWAGNPFVPKTSVQRLACQIDKLEQHIDEYGSVVAKTPDVWGEERLTKYRREYEEVLLKELEKFDFTVNAAIRRSDFAYLANAMALQAAVSGQAATISVPGSRPVTTTNTTREPVTFLGHQAIDWHGQPLERTNTTTTTSQVPATVEQIIAPPEAPTAPAAPVAVNGTPPLAYDNVEVALEPTVKLDQLSRYLNHLHQLRRINDGDDRADFPGYSLSLVRVPVSVLPGKKTREGYGAEVTVIAKPHLHEELLPQTFRHLVVNDIVDQITFPLVKVVDRPDAADSIDSLRNLQARIKELESQRVAARELQTQIAKLEQQLKNQWDDYESKGGQSFVDAVKSNVYDSGWASDNRAVVEAYVAGTRRLSSRKDELNQLRQQLAQLESDNAATLAAVTGTQVSLSPSRRSRMPFPASHLIDVYGSSELASVAELVFRIKGDRPNVERVLILDAQKMLAEELEEAYEFLKQREDLWQYCNQDLVRAVRTDNTAMLAKLRSDWINALLPDVEAGDHLAALTWMIIVESALLNDRLVEDMKQLAAAKNAFCLTTQWMPYFGTNPPPEARMAFNQYVECRWPLHVVALDPVTQDQNVADSFSLRRELQLSLSLAFASGAINAQNFTQYARRIELDMETIALNRTAVGFSHGDDTFGWRFMPRVQTPDIEGNCKTAVNTFLGLGMSRDHDIKARRLEPGIRECTAIVIMPSFVPHIVFDVRTNWFKLTNPAKRQLDLESGVGLSAEITSMRCLATECAQDAEMYRPDEVYRLGRAVEQLERRLPLQTTYVPMPYENSLGGFEFFSSGIPDLAPEIHGFYGEPGLNVGGAGLTTIFLVGDKFSVHETHVVAGNVDIPPENKTIISRQIMKVVVPGNLNVVDGHVDIHVATPYGVSNHLLVPVGTVAPASDAIEEAVARHVAAKHTDKIVWSRAEATGRVFLTDCRKVDRFCLANTVKLADQGVAPFKTNNAEIRCVVFSQAGDKDPVRIGAANISNAVAFDATGDGVITDLDAHLTGILKGRFIPTDAERLIVRGYLRYRDRTVPANETIVDEGAADHRDGQPIIRVESELVIAIDQVDPVVINPTPDCPPAEEPSATVPMSLKRNDPPTRLATPRLIAPPRL